MMHFDFYELLIKAMKAAILALVAIYAFKFGQDVYRELISIR
jgi:chromate transport protein ChrA